MFITENYSEKSENFDWKIFFSQSKDKNILEKLDHNKLLKNIRSHLKENAFQMTFSLTKVIREILDGVNINKNPRIIELGAGTGFLSRCLIEQYEGSAVLVDNNENSFKAYNMLNVQCTGEISYIVEDIFSVDIPDKFDLVCSFGLIEHFSNKQQIIAVHRKYVKTDGYILVLAPLDTHLTRVFFEAHPEINLGYRELLSEEELKAALCEESMNVIKTVVSRGYSYDFIAALCKP